MQTARLITLILAALGLAPGAAHVVGDLERRRCAGERRMGATHQSGLGRAAGRLCTAAPEVGVRTRCCVRRVVRGLRSAAGVRTAIGGSRQSGNVTPEPPISFGMSFIFGKPSLMRSFVSP